MTGETGASDPGDTDPGQRPLPTGELLRLVVEETFSGIAVIDPNNGRFLYANEQACQLLGVQVEETTRLTWQQVAGPDRADFSQHRTQRLFDDNIARTSSYKRLLRADGSWVNLAMVVSRVEIEADGRIVIVIHLDDTTKVGTLSALVRLVASQPDGNTLARVLVLGWLDGLGVRGMSIYRVDKAGKSFVLAGSHLVDRSLLTGFEQVTLDAKMPLGEVYRTGSEYCATMSEMALDYPLSAGWVALHDGPENTEMTILPVFGCGLVNGVVVLSSDSLLGKSWQARNSLDTMCACVACWLGMNSDDRTSASEPIPVVNFRVTDRQRQILLLVGEGHTNQGIATRLGFSEGTIRSDLLRLTRLLQVRGRVSLVDAARRAGLLDLDGTTQG